MIVEIQTGNMEKWHEMISNRRPLTLQDTPKWQLDPNRKKLHDLLPSLI